MTGTAHARKPRVPEERLWQRSSAISRPVDATNDQTVTIELRRADDQLMGKRLHIIAEGSYNGVDWYPLNIPTLVFFAYWARLVFTLNVTALPYWRLRSKPKPPSDLLLRFASE